MWTVEIVVMLGMIVINSVFAGFEIALASITLTRLHVLGGENRSGAAAALYMKQNMEGSLASVQLGITLVGAIAAATGGAGAEETLAPYLAATLGISKELAEILAIAIVVVPLTIVTIIFGELIPKVFALRNKDWVCLRLSPPMYWFTMGVWPIVWALEFSVTTIIKLGERLLKGRIDGEVKSESSELQELRTSAALARTSRWIGAHEEKIILGAAAMSRQPVRAIMLAADHIHLLDVNRPLAECLVSAHLDLHTRFPVAEQPGNAQSIIGYVNFKDIVALMRLAPQEPSLRSIVRAILSFDADAPVSTCLQTLMRERTHIALVRDRANAVIGMVTLEDMIEELVGEIEDEYDRLPTHVAKTGNGWTVGGGVTLAKLQQVANLFNEEPPDGAKTLNDWVIARVGRPIAGGENVEYGNIRIVVRKIRRNKVLEAQIVPHR